MQIIGSLDIYAFFGIAAGVLDLVTCGIYLRSIFRGETKPDRVTWWVLAIVSTMIAVSYYESGARDTAWLPAAYALSFFVTALASLKYGEGPLTLNVIDRISLVGAFLSGIVWWVMHSPVPALFMNILTEFIGLVPTINKAYRRPWTESRTAWLMATLASFLNVLAISEWTLIIALYPIYILITNLVITTPLLKKNHDPAIS